MATERTQRIVRTSAILITLLLTALLLAQGTTQIIASMVLPLESDQAAAPRRPRVARVASEPEQSPAQLARAVLTRNMFDSTIGPMSWDPPVEPVADAGAGGDEQPIVDDPNAEPGPCQTTLRLVASMVVPRVPLLSFASIDVNGKTMLYRPGMQVEGHEVVGIREHRVFLRPSGSPLCQIAMFAPVAQGQPPPPVGVSEGMPAPPPPTTSTSRSGGLGEDELNQGITQVSDTSYTVQRSLLDKVLGNQAELMRMARIIPYEENGRVIGVKVYGIRRSSLLGKLGIQNGDVLRTINGFDLSSPDSALEAYTKLREMDQFSIATIRRGQPRTMEYSVK